MPSRRPSSRRAEPACASTGSPWAPPCRRLGSGARPADRPRRRRVRHHRVRPAAGDRRDRVDGRPVHQHRAGAGAVAARPAARRPARRAQPSRPSCSTTSTSGSPRSAAGRPRRAVRHTARLRELSADHAVGPVGRLRRGDRRRVARRRPLPARLLATPGARLRLLLKHDAGPLRRRRRWSGSCAPASPVLAAFVADAPAGQVGLLGAEERAELLPGWTGPSLDVSPATVPAAFAAQAARTPEATAVVAGDGTLTYAELDARSRGAGRPPARRGRRAGGRRRGRAARSAELVVAMLAVMRAGAAYLPLDPCASGGAAGVRAGRRRRAARGRERRAVAGLPDRRRPTCCCSTATAPRPPAPPPAPTTPPICIHTSGSTGRPKGVLVSHRAIVSQLAWLQDALPLSAADRVLQQGADERRRQPAGDPVAAVRRRRRRHGAGRRAPRPGRAGGAHAQARRDRHGLLAVDARRVPARDRRRRRCGGEPADRLQRRRGARRRRSPSAGARSPASRCTTPTVRPRPRSR